MRVISPAGKNKWGASLWQCRCDCGNVKVVRAAALLQKVCRSCGCLQRELAGRINRTHGLTKTPEYLALNRAVWRCGPDSKDRQNYFERGITVCEEWKDFTNGGVEKFTAHIGAHPGPGYSLDRKENDKGYEPGNVRWVTAKEQRQNQRKRLRIEQWSDEEIFTEADRRRSLCSQ